MRLPAAVTVSIDIRIQFIVVSYFLYKTVLVKLLLTKFFT